VRKTEGEKELVMNSNATYRFQGQGATLTGNSRRLTRRVIRLAVILLLAATAYAQYGGGGGTTGTSGTTGASTTPSYGHGKAIGIGVGAAAAGVSAIYLMTHRASKVTGCTEMADDGLHLTNDKTKRTLALVPGAADIKAGERVELKGKIKKNRAGDQSFLVKTVAKDFGECRASAGAATLVNPQGR
jgi:hypothetical protein